MWHVIARFTDVVDPSIRQLYALYYEGECISVLEIKEADVIALVMLLNTSGAYPERRNPTGS